MPIETMFLSRNCCQILYFHASAPPNFIFASWFWVTIHLTAETTYYSPRCIQPVSPEDFCCILIGKLTKSSNIPIPIFLSSFFLDADISMYNVYALVQLRTVKFALLLLGQAKPKIPQQRASTRNDWHAGKQLLNSWSRQEEMEGRLN